MMPEESCHAAPSACLSFSLSFLDFFLPESGSAEVAVLSPTIAHAAPPPAGVDTCGSIGAAAGSGLNVSAGWAAAGAHSSAGAGGGGGDAGSDGGGGVYAGGAGADRGGGGGAAGAVGPPPPPISPARGGAPTAGPPAG